MKSAKVQAVYGTASSQAGPCLGPVQTLASSALLDDSRVPTIVITRLCCLCPCVPEVEEAGLQGKGSARHLDKSLFEISVH